MKKTRRGRGMAEKRGIPEKSGSLSKGRSRCHHGTTTVQKLDEDLLVSFINLLPLTKRQRIRYLPKKTPEARQRREELAREIETL